MTPAACAAGPAVPAVAGMPGAAPPAAAGPERNGLVLLYVTQTLNGLWLALAVPAMFNADDPTPYGLGQLLGAPTGILFARAVDTSHPVSLGQATAIGWGGWWGWWNGVGFYAMADNTDETDFFRNTTIGLVGGTAVGYLLAQRPISGGDASLVAHASVWGTWYGAVMASLTDAESDAGWRWVLAAGNAALPILVYRRPSKHSGTIRRPSFQTKGSLFQGECSRSSVCCIILMWYSAATAQRKRSPSPKPLIKAVEMLSGRPEETVIVGDS